MKYFLIAGEASGDLHGSALMRELREIDSNAEFCFLGGDKMLSQGGYMVQHYKNMAFMGVINVLLNIRQISKNFEICTKSIRQFQPDVVILIDYPGFNLKIAKYIKTTLNIPIHYYISPKLWAWKEYRIKSIKRYIDNTFVIFPFEVDYFQRLGYCVDYVGNPTVEAVDDFLKDYDNRNKPIIDTSKPIVALVAGSRKQEIKKCLPVMVKMADVFKDYQFVVAKAPGIDRDFYNRFLNGRVKIVENGTYALLKESKAAIVNSGTATLETALIGTPQVIVYHVIGGKIVPLLKKIFIKIPFVSLVNLIAGKEVVKELITPYFTEDNLAFELQKIICNHETISQIELSYKEIRQNLGTMSASKSVSSNIYDLLSKKKRKLDCSMQHF